LESLLLIKHHSVESLNTDGSLGANGDAGDGSIVRNHNGEIVLSSCRHLVACRDALGAELKALLDESPYPCIGATIPCSLKMIVWR
jgi:hypothetical protein